MTAGAGAFSINIDPPSIWLDPAANTSYSGTIIVENRGEESLAIKAYTEDWIFAPDRSKEFKKAGTMPFSCSNWISIYPKNFTLDSGKSQSVQYTITVPAGSSGGRNSVIFFESNVEAPAERSGSRVILAGRIGTIVYVNVKDNVKRSASATLYEVSKPDENKPLNIKMVISNDGNAILSAEGTSVIMDKEGKILGRVAIPKFYLLPGEKTAARAAWFGKLNEGLYDVVTSVDYGAGVPCLAEKEISVKAAGQIKDIKLVPGKTNRLIFRYVNNGNLVTTVYGRAELSTSAGALVKSFKLDPAKILPSSGKTYNFGWAGQLKKGAYSVKIVLDENGTQVIKTGNIAVQ